jgi:hypothetical protein
VAGIVAPTFTAMLTFSRVPVLISVSEIREAFGWETLTFPVAVTFPLGCVAVALVVGSL